jgi:predicted AlkP superfamily phosphohydrolase/phosphomutase/Flp pilus assembly protein TadD
MMLHRVGHTWWFPFVVAALIVAAPPLLTGGCGGEKAPPDPGTKVLILGVDAVDMIILDRLRARGEVPNFERMMAEGSSGLLRSLEPILSPLIWTSIATGKTPDKHGVFDFLVMDPASGQAVPVTSRMREVRALWNIAGARGKEVAFVGWLATWPAETVNGIIVTDRLSYHSADISEESRRSLCSPPSFIDVAERVSADVGQLDLSTLRQYIDVTQEEFDEAVGDAYDISNPINNMRLIRITSEIYRRLSQAILTEKRPDLMGVYFEETDSVGHLFVPYEPPRMPGVTDEEMKKYGGAMDAAYRHMDSVLGEVIDLAGDEYNIMLLSDHGFKTGESRPQSAPPPREAGAARWHRIQGVIMMRGPQIRKGVTLHGASVLDITPTVLTLMGLPVAEDMDGEPLLDAIEPGFLEEFPIQTIESYENEGEEERYAHDAAAGGSEMDEQMIERLKALGYLGDGTDDGSQSGGDRKPSDPDKLATWHSNKGVSLLGAGEYEEAAEAFRLAIESNPASPVAHNNLGLATLEMGRLREAEASFKRAIELDGGYVNAHLNLAVLYDRARRDSEALAEYNRALELEPSKANLRNALGNFYAKRGRFEEALPHMRKANELEPHSAKFHMDYGAACWQTGDMEEAVRQFEQAVSLEPNSARSRLLLAQALTAVGKGQEARGHLERCLEIDPGNAEARRLLGR